ncbi:DUF1196 domain-containing protein [Vibrio cholerae]|nr:DUF1196 domain-containing protein [Vibrio cholerae]
MPLNSITTTKTTAAQWDWKRYALTVPLEAFVMCVFEHFTFALCVVTNQLKNAKT